MRKTIAKSRKTSRTTLAAAAVIIGVLIVFAVLAATRTPQGPPVAVRFNGLASGGIHKNPFGSFTLTNISTKSIEWSAAVEAPLDPDLKSSLQFCSSFPEGRIAPGGITQFECLIAGKKGVPFRVVVTCEESASFVARLWLRACMAIPLLKRLWSPQNVNTTVFGEWCSVSSDYHVRSFCPDCEAVTSWFRRSVTRPEMQCAKCGRKRLDEGGQSDAAPNGNPLPQAEKRP